MRSVPHLFYNFHWILPGQAARAAQDYAGFLGPFLSANAIAAMINLRGHHPEFRWWRRETRICRARGVAHFDAMLDSRLLPTRGMLASLFDAFDATPRPFLLKCSGGQDRTSLAAALFILHHLGWQGLPVAMQQFSAFPYLHFPKPQQRWLSAFPAFALQYAGSMPIGTWIRSQYDPNMLAEWLDAGEPEPRFRGIFPPI